MQNTVKIEHNGKTYTGSYVVDPNGDWITVTYELLRERAPLGGMPAEAFATGMLFQLVTGRKLGAPR